MSITPAYWTLIGEITLVLIGVLLAIIIIVLKDRKNLRDYSLYLKELIKKLKKKIREHEEQDSQDRAEELIRGMIAHVRTEYETQAQGTIEHSFQEGLQDKTSIEQFILITGFQMFSAELMALENSNEPDVAWAKIKSELMPLIQNFLQSVVAGQSSATADDIQQQLESLQQFKQLYFNLQKNMAEQLAEVEQLNQSIAELLAESADQDEIMAVIENNKSHYINMGQLLGMDKEEHHNSVADRMDYSNVIISERKNEIKRLKSKIAQQFDEIWKLQSSLSGKTGAPVDTEMLQAGVDSFARQLKDAELCMETMDMEIQTLTAEITRLEKELSDHQGSDNQDVSQQEQDEMMSCITGLEDSNQEQSERIKQLEAENAQLKAALKT